MALPRKEIDDLLAVAIASGQTQAEAAISLGICSKTVQRRLSDPVFRGKVDVLRQQAVASALNRSCSALAGAVDVLVALLGDDSASIKLRAADLLLAHASRLRETYDFGERLCAIEQRLGGNNDTGPAAETLGKNGPSN